MNEKYQIIQSVLNKDILIQSYSLELKHITRMIIFPKSSQDLIDKNTHDFVLRFSKEFLQRNPIGMDLKILPLTTGNQLGTKFHFIPVSQFD